MSEAADRAGYGRVVVLFVTDAISEDLTLFYCTLQSVRVFKGERKPKPCISRGIGSRFNLFNHTLLPSWLFNESRKLVPTVKLYNCVLF